MDELRGTPMAVGTLEEIIDDNHAIVSTSVGSEYYVNMLSFVDKDLIEPGCTVLLNNKVCITYAYMYSTCPKKKPVQTCAKSTVAAVHINSRKLKHCIRPRTHYLHIEQFAYSHLCTTNEEQPKLSSWCSNSRGMGLLKRWVVVLVASLPSPEQP